MHEIKDHLNKDISQNFNKNLTILKNPKKFSKTPKPRSKCMNYMNNERKRDHTKWFEARKGRKSCGFEGFEREVSVWKVRRRFCQARERVIEKNEKKSWTMLK